MKKTITISIPVYNGKKFILDALRSVINQTVKVDKIIICDNCSNDGTENIINKFIAEHTDHFIDYHINAENIGFQKNFIKCYDLATTDYLLILHADDLLKANAIEKQLTFFSQHPDFAVVGGKGDIIDGDSNLTFKKEKTKDLLFKKGEIYEFIKATSSYIPFSTVMYNLKHCRNIGYLEEESLGPDELYWPRLLKVHPIAVLGESLINNRIYEGQLHVQNAVSKIDENMAYFNDKLDRANLEESAERQLKTRNIIKKQISRISIKFGRDVFIHHKNFKISFKYFLFGINQFPGVVFTIFFVKTILKMLNILK